MQVGKKAQMSQPFIAFLDSIIAWSWKGQFRSLKQTWYRNQNETKAFLKNIYPAWTHLALFTGFSFKLLFPTGFSLLLWWALVSFSFYVFICLLTWTLMNMDFITLKGNVEAAQLCSCSNGVTQLPFEEDIRESMALVYIGYCSSISPSKTLPGAVYAIRTID